MAARKTMITALRTKPSFHNSSSRVSLRSTSAGSAAAARASSRSRIFASPIARSSMHHFGAVDRIGKQQIMDLLFQARGAAVDAADLIDIRDLGLDPARMRRQQQDAIA